MEDYTHLYMFPGGTPTEKRRQFDLGLEDAQNARQQDALQAALEFREKKRQFDMNYGLDRQKVNYETNRPYFEPDSGGGGSASGGGSRGDGGDLFSAAVNEMLAGQSRYRATSNKGKTVSPHNYNHYVSVAINLAQKTGQPLSPSYIKGLQEQAKNMAAQDIAWKNQIDKNN